MQQSDHELRVEEMPSQFNEKIERDVIIISYIGLENEYIHQNWKNREDFDLLFNEHLFPQDAYGKPIKDISNKNFYIPYMDFTFNKQLTFRGLPTNT